MATATSKDLSWRNSIHRLSEENIDAKDNIFWQSFWISPVTLQEFYDFVSIKEIRTLRDDNPTNVMKLLAKLIERIFTFLGVNLVTRENVCEMQTCCRLLIRILPIIFEIQAESVYDSFFWTKFDKNENINSNETDSEQQPIEETEPLGKKLIDAVVDLLFVQKFTIPPLSAVGDDKEIKIEKIAYSIWENGIGTKMAPTSYLEHRNNRQEIMLLLLVLSSHIMYTSPSENLKPNLWLSSITTKLSKSAVQALLCSTLNDIVSFDPIGWAIPYNYIFTVDNTEEYVKTCIQFLLSTSSYQCPNEYPSKRKPSVSNTPDTFALDLPQTTTISSVSHVNMFRGYLSRLHKTDEFNLLFSSLLRLIRIPFDKSQSLFPSSKKDITILPELLILLWELIELNQKFVNFIVKDDKVLTLLIYLIFYAMEAKSNRLSSGVLHISCFIIMFLSSDRSFCVKLNANFNSQLPSSMSFLKSEVGCFGDFLFLSLINLMGPFKSAHYSFNECLMTIMLNISPFIKSLNPTTTDKIVSLYAKLSTVEQLFLEDEQQYKLTAAAIDIISNCIQYQYDGNYNLIYAILRRKELFKGISQMNYETVIGQLRSRLCRLDSSKEMNMEESVSISATETVKTENPPTLTEAQFEIIKNSLNLNIILLSINSLCPEIDKLCIDGIIEEESVLNFLKSGTLVGIIPPSQPILIRKYESNIGVNTWLSSFIYGTMYLNNSRPAIWHGTDVQLFNVSSESNLK